MNKYDFVKNTNGNDKKTNEKFHFTSTHEIKKTISPIKFVGGRNIKRAEMDIEKR
ncbi:hypothetical protein [Bacillus toyonensis]|uniref:hypothetical protein n=1 Tax=Bacillus toyonensis TaxID=155322 RepID=UPI000AE1033B|nr:hypothetical protein [Bacillus toyonensis]